MALRDFEPNQYTQTVWDYLVTYFGTEVGAAAMMANLYAESGCTPWRCQGWYGFSTSVINGCKNYYEQVDDGRISRYDFVEHGWSTNQTIDTTGRNDGYGLAQWTIRARKADFYDDRPSGTGIESMTWQLEYLKRELEGDYPSHSYTDVRDVCRNATDISQLNSATDYVLDHFEGPATPDYAQRERYAEQIYNQYAGGITGYPIFITVNGNGTAWASYNEVEIHRAEAGTRVELGAVAGQGDYFQLWAVDYPSSLQLEYPVTVADNYFTMPSDKVNLTAQFTGDTPTPPYPPIPPSSGRKRRGMPIWMYPLFRT